MAENNTISFKDTLNLPKTDFPMQANAKVEDPHIIKRWEEEKLYDTSFSHNEGKEKFILHDGPPYANGHIHLGHAYNKILKDIVTKSKRMRGIHVPVTPGWDCHGLPIELKVTQEKPGLAPQELTAECRAYAQRWIDTQREEFKRLGVLMQWDKPYTTMDFKYEADTLRAFGVFVADGYIERKNKTVPWCFHDQTVLAAAEIEYHDRKDPSIYVLFPLTAQTVDQAFPEFAGKELNLLIWTTTPWTLPLNRAVLLKPNALYVILEHNGRYIIVGKELADKICAMAGIEKKIVAEFAANDLKAVSPKAQHPFINDLIVPVILDDSVSIEDGTACVHSAPGCGPEDYEIGVKNNLEIFSPLSPDGRYTAAIEPHDLEGMLVTDGQIWVIKKLAELNRLFFKQTITHSYPHCWRCRNGLIFRATKQWFCDLSRAGLKARAIEAVDTITMYPEKSNNRLKATLDGRLEWCLSRQRVWGVPIPGFMCTKCDYTYITQGLIEKVAQQVEQRGIEYWDIVVPEELMPAGFACPMCKGTEFKKEHDILDVWFDSGISHFAVLKPRNEFPADMYLEGKDQHRGWFQSSLLTGIVLEGRAPMKIIMTHGFTVDDKGRKMSKSLGNGIEPQQMIDQLGTDGLRLWVASIDASNEAVVSEILLRNVKEVYRKIRNTCRFLLSNLYDYDHTKDAIPFDQLRAIDQYAIQQLALTNKKVLDAYDAYDITAIFHHLGDYCSVGLSAFYLDIIKDRLYVEKSDGKARRSAQTACYHIVDGLTKMMAPVLSFTAEQVSDHYQKNKKHSIHLQHFADLEHYSKHSTYEEQWKFLHEMRSAILKQIEGLREKGIIKHSLEARVIIYIDEAGLGEQLQPLFELIETSGQTIDDFFREFLIVSQVEIRSSSGDLPPSDVQGLFVMVDRAVGGKCPRCWNWDDTQNAQGLCRRCQRVLEV
ncbi:MAG TPA: isoleucine--tRNA ligase [Candidatus Babeliales bacterium]|nr:isoleucine--tRNA ligase [Candidatus Babeliales bacterium]